MFDNLTAKIAALTTSVGSGNTQATQKRRDEAMRQLRDVLVGADVELSIVDSFLVELADACDQRPSEGFGVILEEKLRNLLGTTAGKSRRLLEAPPEVLIVIGPLGVGKTTMAVKVARYYQQQKSASPLLVTTDTERAAAKEQIRVLAERADIPLHIGTSRLLSNQVSTRDIEKRFKEAKASMVVVDTPGFSADLLQDADKMAGLQSLVQQLGAWRNSRVLYVLDASQGQGAVTTMRAMTRGIQIDAVALARADGTGRGGAALSVSHHTGKGIVFSGTGEGIEDLEVFHPDRIARSLTGGGDMESVIEKAQQTAPDEDTMRVAKRTLSGNDLDFNDVMTQLDQLDRQGGMGQVLKMLPHHMQQRAKAMMPDTDEMTHMRAAVQSMTPEERREPRRINASRKKRIVQGAGVAVRDFNALERMRTQMVKAGSTLKSNMPAGDTAAMDADVSPESLLAPPKPKTSQQRAQQNNAKRKKKQQRKARKKSRR